MRPALFLIHFQPFPNIFIDTSLAFVIFKHCDISTYRQRQRFRIYLPRFQTSCQPLSSWRSGASASCVSGTGRSTSTFGRGDTRSSAHGYVALCRSRYGGIPPNSCTWDKKYTCICECGDVRRSGRPVHICCTCAVRKKITS